jgi:hypothetical protein
MTTTPASRAAPRFGCSARSVAVRPRPTQPRVRGGRRCARSDSHSNTAKDTRAATIGATTTITNPAPMFAPMTPAVRTRQPAPHSPRKHQLHQHRPPAPVQAATPPSNDQRHRRRRHQHDGADADHVLCRVPEVDGPKEVVRVGGLGRQVADQPPARHRHRHDQHHPGHRRPAGGALTSPLLGLAPGHLPAAPHRAGHADGRAQRRGDHDGGQGSMRDHPHPRCRPAQIEVGASGNDGAVARAPPMPTTSLT